MSVRIDRPDGARACVITMDGDMDSSVVPEIRSLVEGELSSGCSVVVLDLSAVDYADSSALGLIVMLDQRLAPLGGRLVLAGADRNVNRVLELSGLVGLAPSVAIASDAASAIGALEPSDERAALVWTQTLSVSAVVERMSGIRARVCELVAPLGLTEAAMFDLKVAVGEALANAVRHGSPGGPSDVVEVTVAAYEDRVEVVVRDMGAGFDGSPLSGDDVYASGGRGVMFMQALMDRVEFSRCDGGGTLVRLTKRLPVGRGQLPVTT